jgi:hypothetical protein
MTGTNLSEQLLSIVSIHSKNFSDMDYLKVIDNIALVCSGINPLYTIVRCEESTEDDKKLSFILDKLKDTYKHLAYYTNNNNNTNMNNNSYHIYNLRTSGKIIKNLKNGNHIDKEKYLGYYLENGYKYMLVCKNSRVIYDKVIQKESDFNRRAFEDVLGNIQIFVN